MTLSQPAARRRLHATISILALALLTVRLSAQTNVRVIKDQTVVWQPNFGSPATVVNSGTILEVVDKRGDWYEVLIPSGSGTTGTGMIAVNQVEPAGDGSAGNRQPRAARRSGDARQAAGAASVPKESGLGFRVFGDAAYERFTASKAFKAVLGHSGGPWFGGGGEVRWNSAFVQASAERFRQTGERVFVSDGEVFKLGIPDTVSMTRVLLTLGYRFPRRGSVPYLGVGAGSYGYKEESKFADPTDNVDRRVMGFHVVGGIEWRLSGWLGAALEGQFASVPNGLKEGAADAFKENNLGGFQARFKLLFGK